MDRIKLAIIGTSEIAYRRFLPAIKENDKFKYVGVASRDKLKTKKFTDEFGGIGYDGYDEAIDDENVDAVYIPLPPALHFEWALKALNKGKHVFLEKPFTTNFFDTQKIIQVAKQKKLVAYENYMFEHHSQIEYAKKLIKGGEIGEIRLIKASFGFPKRASDDFRYNKSLGGGALLDCGGYPIKLASILLGEKTEVKYSQLNYSDDYSVDLYGNATLVNEEDLACQISFGMDNSYKCELELWGSKGNAVFSRIFTAPNDYAPIVKLTKDNKSIDITLDKDDQFYNSIDQFAECLISENYKYVNYDKILKQAYLIQTIQTIDIN